MLTWSRIGELRHATKAEIESLEAKEPVWRIDACRLKMKREHIVPLSRQAAELVKRRIEATEGDYFFLEPSQGNLSPSQTAWSFEVTPPLVRPIH